MGTACNTITEFLKRWGDARNSPGFRALAGHFGGCARNIGETKLDVGMMSGTGNLTRMRRHGHYWVNTCSGM